MNAREQAEHLRQEAIKTLLTEKQAIVEQLKLLGYGQPDPAPQKRRGRPPRATLDADQGKEHQAESQTETLPTSRTD